MHNINTRNEHHFVDQMPKYLVFKKSTFMLASTFPSVYHKVWQSPPQEWQGKSPRSLKKIPTYTLLLFWRWNFVCVFIIRFCKTFAVFYTGKFMYIRVFMTCSTPYCLCNIFTDQWTIHICILYIYIYIYVCVCVCVCVCVYTHTKWTKLLLAGGKEVSCTTMKTVCCT